MFYKLPKENNVRFYGVELEIDGAGRYDDNAEKIYDTANVQNEVLYIKSDGSLDEGMELVSHPCSIDFHRKKFPWEDIVRKALSLGYRSHNTSTCGLHVHIGRKQLGYSYEEQEEVISRIMFFSRAIGTSFSNSHGVPHTALTAGQQDTVTMTSRKRYLKRQRKALRADMPV